MNGGVVVLAGVALPLSLLALVLWWNDKQRRGQREFRDVVVDDEALAVLEESLRMPGFVPEHERRV